MPFRETTDADLTLINVGFGIDITSQCNLDCKTCYYMDSSLNRPDPSVPYISVEHFKRAIWCAAIAGFREIYILGGEPTLHPQIIPFLEYAKSFDFEQVLLVTNGLMLSDLNFCKSVAATGADIAVQRHVVGHGTMEQKIQNAIVGRNGTLSSINKAFANIEAVFDSCRVAVQCCITRPVVECGQLYAVFRYAKEHHFEHIIECTKASPRYMRKHPFDLSPEELLNVYETLQSIDITEFNGRQYPFTPQAYGKTCHMPENSLHCLMDGTIVPCVGQPFPLGNIFNGSDHALASILDSPQRAFFRHPLERIAGHCRECPYFMICTGGCRGDAYFLTGCFNASAIQCPQLGNKERRLALEDFMPSTCDNCELQMNSLCGKKKNIDEILSRYFGSKYQKKEDTLNSDTILNLSPE
ncbi:MAG TPA: radical SAM protein [Smithella sp.]|mgnify:CR=1 FL=1|nr:radical SAM protein [Smithella sp.]